eukprot:TRINITY_DN30408_c0_g1_i1.p1 TRINITY_DN30408_c0_g1~~TRINITY_DN30408_c0_g1_i1.p1  ORF type:complete len:572 (+),score=179.32 TRINITY_DN30408_c0_g1_i1:65-1780(+)
MAAAAAEEWDETPLAAAIRHVTDAVQEARWADAHIDGREHLSTREAVLHHRVRLMSAVRDFTSLRQLAAGMRQKKCTLWTLPHVGWEGQPDDFIVSAVHSATGQGPAWQLAQRVSRPLLAAEKGCPPGRVLLCVRKRPLLPHETGRDEWDAVDCGTVRKAVLCHDGRLARNGRRLELFHRLFSFDKVWGAAASTDSVYAGCVAPLLKWAKRARGGTLLLHGQTGSGKTHTMVGVLERLVQELEGEKVRLQFFEVHGRRCLDLLNERRPVRLMADADDAVHVRGAVSVECTVAPTSDGDLMASARGGGVGHVDDGLVSNLRRGLALRASQATEKNVASSRSHAVCSITFAGGGSLRVVDLAGSERNLDTTGMTAQEHRESAEINSALVALKDCFREWEISQQGGKGRPPFRSSRLTQVLRSCFIDTDHRTALLACVSPCATDVLHTVNTLRHTAMMSAAHRDHEDVHVDLPVRMAPVGKPVELWTPEEVVAWLSCAEHGRFANVVLPPRTDGKLLCEMSGTALRLLHAGTMRAARAADEGESWNIVGGRGAIGAALFAAIERERRLCGVACR